MNKAQYEENITENIQGLCEKVLITPKTQNHKRGFPMNINLAEIRNILQEEGGLEKYFLHLIKSMMETLMKAELTEFLQYSPYEKEGKQTSNSRNGYYTRDYDTRYGKIEELKIPRDREGQFRQHLIEPYKRREDWLEDLIIWLLGNRSSDGFRKRLYSYSE